MRNFIGESRLGVLFSLDEETEPKGSGWLFLQSLWLSCNMKSVLGEHRSRPGLLGAWEETLKNIPFRQLVGAGKGGAFNFSLLRALYSRHVTKSQNLLRKDRGCCPKHPLVAGGVPRMPGLWTRLP